MIDEGEEDRQPCQGYKLKETKPVHHDAVAHQQDHYIFQNVRVMCVGDEVSEPREIPKVVEPVKNGKERQPGFPAEIDQEPFMAPQLSGDKRFRGGIKILPPSPDMMPVMNQLPRMKGNEREEGSNVPEQRV